MNDITIIMLNLFIILVGMLFFQLWYDHKVRSDKEIKVMSIILPAIVIMFCIGFTLHLCENFFFDLRQIPLWLAGLYGGPVVSISLLLVTVIFRSFFGGLGIVVTAIVGAAQVGVCIFLHKRFLNMSPKQRILCVVSLSTISILSSHTIASILFHSPVEGGEILFYLLFHISGTLICSLTIEGMIRNKLQYDKNLKDKKMELASHLASSFGHEVRNPMTSSIGFLQLM